MDNSIEINQFGATITVNIDPFTYGDLMVKGLIEAARQIEAWKDPTEVAIWEGIMTVLPYFCNPTQMKELADYQTDADWINIVANKAA